MSTAMMKANAVISWSWARAAAVMFCALAGMGVLPMTIAAAEEASAPVAASGLVGWLDIAPEAEPGGKGTRLAIAGRAFALAEVKGRYTLDVRRRGKGGASNSRQSGAFTVAAGQAAVLSRTTINTEGPDRLEIILKLFVGDVEVYAVTMRPAASTLESRAL